jgi:hypothetical protein
MLLLSRPPSVKIIQRRLGERVLDRRMLRRLARRLDLDIVHLFQVLRRLLYGTTGLRLVVAIGVVVVQYRGFFVDALLWIGVGWLAMLVCHLEEKETR